jgi:hypothetical protein
MKKACAKSCHSCEECADHECPEHFTHKTSTLHSHVVSDANCCIANDKICSCNWECMFTDNCCDDYPEQCCK